MGITRLVSRPLPRATSLFHHLNSRIDPGRWWPADTRFEIIVGAILTQNTAWVGVERSLTALRSSGLLDPAALAGADPAALRDLIRPSGTMNRKADALLAAANWWRLDREFAGLPANELRRRLLELPSIGPETADVIGLYVYSHPLFIYDAYARRMLRALGAPATSSYEAARAAHPDLASGLTLKQARQFHGLIVEAGKIAHERGWAPLLAGLDA